MFSSINKIRSLFVSVFTSLLVLFSCIPVFDSNFCIVFKNSTDDTLLIGAAYCNDIDSVVFPLYAECYIYSDSSKYHSEIKLWHAYVRNSDIIYPDSLCGLHDDIFHSTNDTCYFFLVKYKDAKAYSYDEICAKKMYEVFVVTKNANGDFDRNIKYMKQSEP